MSSNKNSEFKVPFPPRSVTQTLSNTRPLEQNQKGSSLTYLQPIVDKLVLNEKLRILPIDEVEKLTRSFCDEFNQACMSHLAEALRQTNPNSAPSVINDNGSVLHSIMAPVGQLSARSCSCQGSTCGSEMGNPVKEPPLKPIPKRPVRSKPKTVPQKFCPTLETIPEAEKSATNARTNARTSRINTVPRSQSATRPRSNAARSTQPKTQSVIPSVTEETYESEVTHTSLDNEVAVVINKVSEAQRTKNPRRKTGSEPKKIRAPKLEMDYIIMRTSSLIYSPPQKKSRKKPEILKNTSKNETETKNKPAEPSSGEADAVDQTDEDMFGPDLKLPTSAIPAEENSDES